MPTPPTDRLFWLDPALVSFEATVLSANPSDSGLEVVLDRTAFYPDGGGQPDDRGTLGGFEVRRLEERDGVVVHHLPPGTALAAGARVQGEVDAGRRRDHRQQHSGQHLLSAVFVASCGAETVSFHLGEEICTIDLERLVSPEETAAAELAADARIAEDRPIGARIVGPGSPDLASLRKQPPAGVEEVRILEIDGVDRTPCGGTHCSRTSEIRLVMILGSEKAKGRSRISFVCGDRALARARADRNALAAASRELAVAPADVPAKLRRLLEEGKATEKSLREWRSRALDALVESIAAPEGGPVVRRLDPPLGPEDALDVAKRISASGRSAAIGASSAAEATVVIALPSGEAGPVASAVTAAMGGKGGGRGGFARLAGGDPARLDAALAAAREQLSRKG